MNKEFRKAIIATIRSHKEYKTVITSLKYDHKKNSGQIEYNKKAIKINSSTVGFSGHNTKITDEELVRAYLTLKLVSELEYDASNKIIQFEKSYKSVGREGKGGRVDITVKKKDSDEIFLFIECKEPEKFDADIKVIDGQLFRLSKQERIRPTNLVYYTIEFNSGSFKERTILI